MDTILDGLRWLTTWSNWGPEGEDIGLRVVQHLWYSLVATLIAVAIGLPLGLAIGHTGRGKFVAANMAGLWRAIPTIGVVVLAVPPIVLNTVAGLESVSPDVKDAATGMGLTRWQRLWRVEVPNALPLILAGVRSAANQVIATATVAGLICSSSPARMLTPPRSSSISGPGSVG